MWVLACTAPEDTGSPLACADGEVLDGAVCVPEHCGAGAFGDRDGDWFVDPLNLGQQDGTRDHPYADANEALIHAAAEDTVVLSSGTHKGLLRMDLAARGVQVVGRCKELTVLDGDGELVTVYGHTTGTHVEHVTVTGAVEAGVFTFDEDVLLRDVDIVRPGYVGFWVAERGDALLERVHIRDPIEDPQFNSAWGVAVTDDSTLILRDVQIENAIDAGVFLEDAGAFDAERLTVLDTTATVAGTGSALVALRSGPLHIRDSTFVGSQLAGLLLEPDSPTLIENCHIEAVRPASPTDVYSAGVLAVETPVTVRDTTIRDVHGTGAEVYGGTAELVLERVDIQDVFVTDTSYASGFGLTVREGLLDASDVTLTNTMAVGAWASHQGTLQLRDVLIDGVVQGPSNPAAAGVYTRQGAHAQLVRVQVQGLGGNAISVGPGTTATAQDVHVQDIQAVAGVPGTGRCVEVEQATLEMQHSLLQGCHEVAVLASGAGTHVSLDDVTVQDVAATPDYPFGLGVLAQDDAVLVGQDVDISGTASSAGAAALYGQLTLTDSVLHDTLLSDDHALGYAVLATSGGQVTLTGTDIQTAGLAGLLSSGAGSSISMSDGTVQGVYVGIGADTAFGALVQDEGALQLADVAMDAIQGPGIACSSGATLEGDAVEISDARFAGVVLQGCRSALTDLHIEGVAEDPQAGGGLGVFIDGSGHGAGTEQLQDVVVRDAPLGGVVGQGPGSWSLVALNLHGGPGVALGPQILNGHALLLQDCGDVVADGQLAFGNAGLFLHGCAPSLGTLDVHDNGVDVHQQACEDDPVAVPDGASHVTCPDHDALLLELGFDARVDEPQLSP